MGLIDSIIGVESGGNPNATNPRSSASGLGQFIDSTWLDTIKAARPDIAQGKSDAELLALKTDPQLSREMTQAYADQNGKILAQAGHEVTPGSTYLAHFAGPQGAVSVLSADPTTPVSRLLKASAIEANPFLQGMTAGDLRAWADRKMGNKSAQPQPAPASPAAPSTGLLSAPPTGGLLQAPTFPAQAQQQPQQAAPEQPFQMSGIEAPPIFFAQRKMPDLTRLKAAFKAPVFRG